MCAYLRYASTMARFVTYTCLLAILLCIVFVTALCSVAWHITYLFFGGRWRCCCLCVLFLHPAPLWSPLFVVLPACEAWGFGVCVFGVRAPPVPRHSWLGCALWVCVLGLRFWLRLATPCWGLWCVGWLLPGTCSYAVVRCVVCALPGFAPPGGRCGLAHVLVPWWWPAACLSGVARGPVLVRRASSSPVALGAPVPFPVAVVPFATPGACAPGFTG